MSVTVVGPSGYQVIAYETGDHVIFVQTVLYDVTPPLASPGHIYNDKRS